MKFNSLSDLEKFLRGGQTSSISTLYLFLGKENYRVHEAVNSFINFLLPNPQDRKLSLTNIDGHATIKEDELLDSLNAPSFLSPLQIVWVQHVDKCKKSIQETIENYCLRPSRSTYLILSAPSWSKQTHFYKNIDKNGVVVEIEEIKPWEKEKYLVDWVCRQTITNGKKISYSTSQHFIKTVGLDQSLIASELEKLLCYCIDRNEIISEDIMKICANQHVETIWQLGEAIFQFDTSKALQISKDLLLEGQALLPLLRQLRSQFQTGYQISLLLLQKKQPHEITMEFPYMKGQILDRNLKQSMHYGAESFRKGLLALDAAEMKIKNSSAEEELIFELLMIQLTHPR